MVRICTFSLTVLYCVIGFAGLLLFTLKGPLKKIEETDSRLQVIMKFVGSCPSRPGLQSGRKSSLTEIIDAVTQKVKDDPSLAKPFTEAINAAVVAPGDSPPCHRHNTRGARESV